MRRRGTAANAENAAEEARARAVWEMLGPTYDTHAQTALRFGLACLLLPSVVIGIGETWHLDEALTAAAETGPLPAAAGLELLWCSHPAFRW